MQNDEQEIRQLVAAWIAATKAGDSETVLSLMAEDVVFLLPGQPPMIGRAAFAAATPAQSGQEPPQFDGRSCRDAPARRRDSTATSDSRRQRGRRTHGFPRSSRPAKARQPGLLDR